MPDPNKPDNKKRLGQGLAAIIQNYRTLDEEIGAPGDTDSFRQIPIAKIKPNPFQPRQAFDQESLNELAASIEAKGLVQPITVRPVDGAYELIAGERRWRAVKQLGWDEIPAYLLEVSSEVDMLELALIENLQRQNLNPLEEAEAYRLLIDKYSISQETLGQSLGKNRSTVTNTLRLLKLPEEIKRSLRNLQISAGHARAILGLENSHQQLNLWRRILKKSLSVRETEAAVRQAMKNHSPSSSVSLSGTKSIYVRNLEERWMTVFGTRVSIKPGRKQDQGKIEIEYYSAEDLARLMEIIDTLRH